MERKGVRVRPLAHNTSRVKGPVGTLGCGLKQMTNRSIIHTNMHKPNNKLVNVSWNTFGERTNHKHTQTHKIHHSPDLGEAITFPFILFYVISHRATSKCHFVSGLPT
jgi:hypothetical protein